MCDVWWGIVEGEAPRRYEWRGYKELVEMCARCDVTLDVVLSFSRVRPIRWATGVRDRASFVGLGRAARETCTPIDAET